METLGDEDFSLGWVFKGQPVDVFFGQNVWGPLAGGLWGTCAVATFFFGGRQFWVERMPELEL